MRSTKTCCPALVGVLALIVAQGAAAQRGNPRLELAGQSIDAMIADFMREHDVAGVALAIVQAPYVTRATGHGVANAADGAGAVQLVSPNTLFELGRLGDAYAAVAVLQLVETGKLALDEPVARYLPHLEAQPPALTVRQLLAQRTGSPATTARVRELVAHAAGESYQDFVRRNQIARLGLTHTFFAGDLDPGLDPAPDRVPREPLATTGKHREFLRDPRLIDPTEPASGRANDGTAPPGAARNPDALWASAVDVSRWDIALAGEILIRDPALRRLLYRPGRSADGTGTATSGPWDFPGHPGLMVVTGGGRGFSSLLSRFTDPSELVCVTLLANREGLDLTQLARRIAGAFDARLGPPARAAALRVQQSPYDVATTLSRLASALRQGGATIMARLDHAEDAKSVALDLPATEELLFGNPAAGTLLLQSNRAVAVDLPLRAVAWEENGEVWVAASDPVELAHRHAITDRDELVRAMRASIDAALLAAVSPGETP